MYQADMLLHFNSSDRRMMLQVSDLAFAQLLRCFPMGGLLMKSLGQIINRIQKKASDLDFWTMVAAELTRDCKTSEEKQTVLLSTCRERAYPRCKTVLKLDDTSFSGKRVLEVQSGPHCAIVGFQDCEKYATDTMVQQYRDIGYPLDDYGVSFSTCTPDDMPFENDFFDVVISMNDLGELQDLTKAIREIARVLRPGGRFIGELHIHNTLADKALSDNNVHPIDELFSQHRMHVFGREYLCTTSMMSTDRYYIQVVKGLQMTCLPDEVMDAPHSPYQFDGLCKSKGMEPSRSFDLSKVVAKLTGRPAAQQLTSHADQSFFEAFAPTIGTDVLDNSRKQQVDTIVHDDEAYVLDGTYGMLSSTQDNSYVTSEYGFWNTSAERGHHDVSPERKVTICWYPEHVSLEDIQSSMNRLSDARVTATVNIVASLNNMNILTNKYNVTLDDLSNMMNKQGAFLNVLPDTVTEIGRALIRCPEYIRMLLRYTFPNDLKEQLSTSQQPTRHRAHAITDKTAALDDYVDRTHAHRKRMRTYEQLFGQIESPGWTAILERISHHDDTVSSSLTLSNG